MNNARRRYESGLNQTVPVRKPWPKTVRKPYRINRIKPTRDPCGRVCWVYRVKLYSEIKIFLAETSEIHETLYIGTDALEDKDEVLY